MTLTPEQEKARTSAAKRLRIHAGPGSGKTEVMAQRAAWLIASGQYEPRDLVLMTYTRAMAGDLRRRVARALPDEYNCSACGGVVDATGFGCPECLGTGKVMMGEIQVGTIHGVAAQIVREAAAPGVFSGRSALAATRWLSDDAPFSFCLPEDLEDLTRHAQKTVGKITQKALLAGLSRIGDELVGDPCEELRRQLRIRGMITYDDILTLLGVVLSAGGEHSDDCAMGLGHRWCDCHQGMAVGDVYPVLMLDERQDLTGQHWEIVKKWAPQSLTAVGDGAQAIFGFLRGHGDDGAQVTWDEEIQLDVNFRSGQAIVDICNATRAALAAEGACVSLPQKAHSEAPGVVWRRFPEDGTKDTVECALAFLDEGWDPSAIAVLAATWDDLGQVAAELKAVGIPVDIPDDTSGDRIWRTIAARAMIAAARMATRGADRHDLAIIFKAAGLKERRLEACYAQAFASHTPIAEELDIAVSDRRAGIPAGGKWWSRLLNASTMLEIANMVEAIPGAGKLCDLVRLWHSSDAANASPESWLSWLATDSRTVADPERRGVILRTIHAAKGLEFPAVIVHNACMGGVPPRWAKDETTQREWGRALFVALSRAADALVVVSPRELRGKTRLPSRWLPGEK